MANDYALAHAPIEKKNSNFFPFHLAVIKCKISSQENHSHSRLDVATNMQHLING
jgi:hypothetical protein